jgi:hypothetical protein
MGHIMQQQVVINGKLMFDLWRNGYWIGMAEGETIEQARQSVVEAQLKDQDKIIMLPYYGKGTSVQTYEAVMVSKPKTVDCWANDNRPS